MNILERSIPEKPEEPVSPKGLYGDCGMEDIPDMTEIEIAVDPDAVRVDFIENRLELCRQSDGSTQTAWGDIIRAGSDPGCGLRIEASDVAGHHATFFFESASWYVRDEHSESKTYLNATALQPGQTYELHIGDIVAFGTEAFCLFKDYSTTHDYEPYDEDVVGGSYSICKRCGFRVFDHPLTMEKLGYGPHVIIPPCRNERYTICSCGRIVGDGRNETCTGSDSQPRLCPHCGLKIDGHHTCSEALELAEMVKRFPKSDPPPQKKRNTWQLVTALIGIVILAWVIAGILLSL